MLDRPMNPMIAIIGSLALVFLLTLPQLKEELIEDIQYLILIDEIEMSEYPRLAYRIDWFFFLLGVGSLTWGLGMLYISRLPHAIWEMFLAD